MCQVSKLLSWDVGKIDASKLPNLRGSVNLITGATPEPTNPSIRWILLNWLTKPACELFLNFQRAICNQSTGGEWSEGEQARHVWGEVQAVQGGEVPHQGWQVPGQDVMATSDCLPRGLGWPKLWLFQHESMWCPLSTHPKEIVFIVPLYSVFRSGAFINLIK